MRQIAELLVGVLRKIICGNVIVFGAQQLIDPAVAAAVYAALGEIGRHAAGTRNLSVVIERAHLVGVDGVILLILIGKGVVGSGFADHLELVGIHALAINAIGRRAACP